MGFVAPVVSLVPARVGGHHRWPAIGVCDGALLDRAMPFIVDLVQEIHRRGRQVAAVRVDADRKITNAIARVQDCAEHGKDIARLEEQVQFFDRDSTQNNNDRVALVDGIFRVRKALGALAGEDPAATVGDRQGHRGVGKGPPRARPGLEEEVNPGPLPPVRR